METCPLQSSGPSQDRGKERSAARDWKASTRRCKVQSCSLVILSFVIPPLLSLREGTSGSAVKHQIVLKAVMLKSAVLEMRCSAVAAPAAGTLLRNCRNLLCMQWRSLRVYRVWSLPFFNPEFRAACVPFAGPLSASVHPLPGHFPCSGMTMPFSERLLP